jgi:ribosome-associated protein
MGTPLIIDPRVTIPAEELQWTATRSSGAGGQNVNKVSSRVELRFDLEGTRALDPAVVERLRNLARNTLDAEGNILVKSDKTRDQPKNLADARGKLREMVLAALVVPKTRRPTRVSRRQKARRVDDKRRQGEKKKARTSAD